MDVDQTISIATETIPFGKHKGKPVEALRGDPTYLEWLMGQDWFREKYQRIYQLVINNFGEPSETPAQNKITVRFLDEKFCLALFSVVKRITGHDPVSMDVTDEEEFLKSNLERREQKLREIEQGLNEKGYDYDLKRQKETVEAWLKDLRRVKPEDCKLVCSVGFEHKGWTAQISLHRGHSYRLGSADALIKVRPSLGDDFPTILRQMKAGWRDDECNADHAILLIEQYAGSGGSLDQVRKVFHNEGFLVVTVAEVEDYIDEENC